MIITWFLEWGFQCIKTGKLKLQIVCVCLYETKVSKKLCEYVELKAAKNAVI